MNNFQNEWAIIHSNIEKYERFSLIIKLSAIFISFLSVFYAISEWFAMALILTLWLQDGIWKTFQKRLETRIIYIEQQLLNKANDDSAAFQLYSQWGSERSGVAGLIKEYFLSATKPTVAYPYALLLSLILIVQQYG